jgi:periplasmic copper chaperone A
VKPLVAAALLVFVASGCTRSGETPLGVSNLRVFAPLPGRSESVAYMDVENRNDDPVSIDAISSPAFGRVEIHETRIVDGVAHMQRVKILTVAGNSKLSLAPGGMHVMLLDPQRALLPGGHVELRLHFSDGGLLELDAPVRTRAGAENE